MTDEFDNCLDRVQKMNAKIIKCYTGLCNHVSPSECISVSFKSGAKWGHDYSKKDSAYELIDELENIIRDGYEDYYRWIDSGDISVTSEYTDCIHSLGAALELILKEKNSWSYK